MLEGTWKIMLKKDFGCGKGKAEEQRMEKLYPSLYRYLYETFSTVGFVKWNLDPALEHLRASFANIIKFPSHRELELFLVTYYCEQTVMYAKHVKFKAIPDPCKLKNYLLSYRQDTLVNFVFDFYLVQSTELNEAVEQALTAIFIAKIWETARQFRIIFVVPTTCSFWQNCNPSRFPFNFNFYFAATPELKDSLNWGSLRENFCMHRWSSSFPFLQEEKKDIYCDALIVAKMETKRLDHFKLIVSAFLPSGLLLSFGRNKRDEDQLNEQLSLDFKRTVQHFVPTLLHALSFSPSQSQKTNSIIVLVLPLFARIWKVFVCVPGTKKETELFTYNQEFQTCSFSIPIPIPAPVPVPAVQIVGKGRKKRKQSRRKNRTSKKKSNLREKIFAL